MKAIMILFVSLFLSSAALADLDGFATVGCKYKSGSKTKKPVVTISTVYGNNNYEPTVTLSVAYVDEAGDKIIENAVVENAYYTENYEGYVIEAITTSYRNFVITIYVETGDSSIVVDDLYQDHMNSLKCTFTTAG